MKFGADIVLDIVCYRRHGHNESDEPAFTQPIMYGRIKEMRTTRTLYAEKLAAEGSVPAEELQGDLDAFNATLEDAFEAAQTFKPNKADWLEGHWSGLKSVGRRGGRAAARHRRRRSTRCARSARRCARVPADFGVNPKIARQLEAKKQAIESGEGLDWATGEALAFGTLLLEGHRVRLSGEDVQRGTFSHRHAVLVDQSNQAEYVPLNNIRAGQPRFEAFNSPAVASSACSASSTATRWPIRTRWCCGKAQFGDFANGAQVIIDQFIASAETKWLRMSGLVMLLPHGYEGQGPEHSSARLERYLQLCAERNMRVVQLHHAGQLLPRAAPPAEGELPQAAGADDAEVAAAPQAGGQQPGRFRPRQRLPLRDPGDRRDRAGGAGEARRALHRQGLLRPAAGAARQGHQGRRHRARRADATPSRRTACAKRARALRATPRWCGARRSPRTWAPGPSWTAASRRC